MQIMYINVDTPWQVHAECIKNPLGSWTVVQTILRYHSVIMNSPQRFGGRLGSAATGDPQ
jgi:hypothetical protein